MLVFEHGIALDSHVILCAVRRHGQHDETATACMPHKHLELKLLHEWVAVAMLHKGRTNTHIEGPDSICNTELRSLCTLRCCTPSGARSSPVTAVD